MNIAHDHTAPFPVPRAPSSTPGRQAGDVDLPATASINLDDVMFSAKVDFVTLRTLGRIELPKLTGKPKWARREQYKRLTIHDPTPQDLALVASILGPVPVLELEVAVDIRVRPGIAPPDRLALLKRIMVDMFAMQLDPRRGREMTSQFRAFYSWLESGSKVRPFNLRLPPTGAQQLHGGRRDPAQVKAYLKVMDQGCALHPDQWVARVEVRLSGLGLTTHGLDSIAYIPGFRFRKLLMPYFTHVKGTQRSKRSKTLRGPLLETTNAYHHREDVKHWDRSGVGAFVPGGPRQSDKIRLLRNVAVNGRIGQALLRLERQFRVREFVRLADENPRET